MNFAFNSLHEFMAMGHQGVYVWSAWFITLTAIVFLILQSRHVRKRFIRDELVAMRLQKARADRLKQESLR